MKICLEAHAATLLLAGLAVAGAVFLSGSITSGQGAGGPPQAEIGNGLITAMFYLPDAKTGYYRGTRFEWSGVIGSLTYQGHNFYGPWFTKTDPKVIDFVYKDNDIVAGPCSAITGPVEEFSTGNQALGYDEAKVGGTFIKIGVGVLRKPQENAYNRFKLYDIVDAGNWKVEKTPDSITFTQDLMDPASGYGYSYQKIVRLSTGKPEMVMDHKLKNTGKKQIVTNVYNHNFVVIDGQPTGPDFVLKVPYDLKAPGLSKTAAEVKGKEFHYLKLLKDQDVVSTNFQGFGSSASDYEFTIENKKVGAGMKITGDRPLSKVMLWSIRSVLSVEPFVNMTIEPGQEFTWKYTYTYYVTNKS